MSGRYVVNTLPRHEGHAEAIPLRQGFAACWLAVMRLRRLHCENGTLATFPVGFVDALRHELDDNSIASPDQSWCEPGSRDRRLSGHIADDVGALLQLPAKDRVTLLPSVLGHDVEVRV